MVLAAAGRAKSRSNLRKTVRNGKLPSFLNDLCISERQLVPTLIWLWLSHRFSHVFWIDASSRSTIQQSYRDIAAQVHVAGDELTDVNEARTVFDCLCEEWLLLVDGLDDIDAMSGLWPPGRYGNVLYTSRNPVPKELSPDAVCEVAELEKNSAVELLLDAARLQQHASNEVVRLAESIVDELGSLALAVSQAGAYMAQGECCIHDFLETFTKHRAQLLSANAYKDASTYEQAVYATWGLSYSAIQRRASNPARQTSEAQAALDAIQLLNMLAFFHNENVTEDIFRRAAEDEARKLDLPREVDFVAELFAGADLPENLLPLDCDGKWDMRHYRQAVRLLSSYSLLSVNRLSGSLSMHRLVHGWAFDRQSPDMRLSFMRMSAATLAGSVLEELGDDKLPLLRDLVPHVTALYQRADDVVDPLPHIYQKRRIARIYYSTGKWNEAEKLQRVVYESHKALFGKKDLTTLSSLSALASYTELAGRASEAEELYRQEYKLARKMLGRKHPATLMCLGNIAGAVRRQGRAAEAEKLHREEIELKKKVLGADSLVTANSLNSMAAAILHQGRAAEAEELHRQVFELRKKELGPEDPDTLISMGNIASALWRQGKTAEAEKLHRQVFELKTKVHGLEHPSTLVSLGSIAAAVWQQGQFVEAEDLHRQVFELSKKVLGTEHPETLSSMGNVGLALLQQGRAAEAEEMHRQEHELKKKVLGAENPDTLVSMGNIGLAVQQQGRWAEAEVLHRQAFERLKKALGPEHLYTLISMGNYASALSQQGRRAEAVELHRQDYELKKKVMGPEHPETHISLNNLAMAVMQQGRVSEAEKLHRQAFELSNKMLGSEHPSTLESMGNIALALWKQGRAEEAEKMHRQAFEMKKKVLGPENRHTLASMYQLALPLHRLGHKNEAQALVGQCYDLLKKTVGEDHPHAKACLAMINKWQQQAGEEIAASALDAIRAGPIMYYE